MNCVDSKCTFCTPWNMYCESEGFSSELMRVFIVAANNSASFQTADFLITQMAATVFTVHAAAAARSALATRIKMEPEAFAWDEGICSCSPGSFLLPGWLDSTSSTGPLALITTLFCHNRLDLGQSLTLIVVFTIYRIHELQLTQ